MKHEIRYTTSDLGVAASILATGADFIGIEPVDERRVSFVFDGEDLRKVEDLYWQQKLPLDAYSLFSAIKQLKSHLYGRKR